ncbi:MAG: hypothetical protein KDE14_03905 [Rhodobacteraceae bacterium]|nr:hypothetical protein [Paracoccaceae bacterium]
MTITRRTWLVRTGITGTAALMASRARAADAPKLLGGKLFFMVRRTYAQGIDIAALRTPAEPAHRQHLLKFGQTVVASALIDDTGARIGSVSISDINTRKDIERYVYDDPFTKAGIYGSIAITPVDLYKVDGSYNRAPAWFAPELRERQLAEGYDVPVLPTGDAGAKTMFLLSRHYIPKPDFSRLKAEHDAAHKDYVSALSPTVFSAAGFDAHWNRVSDMAVADFSDRAAMQRYVDDDPFTKAGMFTRVDIERVDLYKLDGRYNRAPGWFADDMKRRQDSRAGKT